MSYVTPESMWQSVEWRYHHQRWLNFRSKQHFFGGKTFLWLPISCVKVSQATQDAREIVSCVTWHVYQRRFAYKYIKSRSLVCPVNFIMSNLIEERVCLKFCFVNEISCANTLNMLVKLLYVENIAKRVAQGGQEVVEHLPHSRRLI